MSEVRPLLQNPSNSSTDTLCKRCPSHARSAATRHRRRRTFSLRSQRRRRPLCWAPIGATNCALISHKLTKQQASSTGGRVHGRRPAHSDNNLALPTPSANCPLCRVLEDERVRLAQRGRVVRRPDRDGGERRVRHQARNYALRARPHLRRHGTHNPGCTRW